MTLNSPNVVTMDRRACPFLGGAPCLGAACALWMHYTKHDGSVVECCTFVLSTILQEQTVVETIHTQASVDKVATEVQSGFVIGARTMLAIAASRGALDPTHE